LMNLLSNANKYALSGGTITIRAYVEDDRLVLEVEDNGPGVLPGEQARLFERFYRAPSTEEKARGSGLGLAIVKSVVERHGGRVFVQSRVGQGSIFGMCFPLADDE
jgi:two-component system phosphate regulon sensor histidine kinase PhoR